MPQGSHLTTFRRFSKKIGQGGGILTDHYFHIFPYMRNGEEGKLIGKSPKKHNETCSGAKIRSIDALFMHKTCVNII